MGPGPHRGLLLVELPAYHLEAGGGGSPGPSVVDRRLVLSHLGRRDRGDPVLGGKGCLPRGPSPRRVGGWHHPYLVRIFVKNRSPGSAEDAEKPVGILPSRCVYSTSGGALRRRDCPDPVPASFRFRDSFRGGPLASVPQLLGGPIRRPSREGVLEGGDGYLPLLRRLIRLFSEELDGVPLPAP